MDVRCGARRLAVGVAGVALLAGCQSEPEPRFGDPSPSASDSGSPSASPSESEAAERLSPEETVRAWVDAHNDVVADGSTASVRDLSAPGCTTCSDIVDPIKQVHEDGGRFDTDGWRVENVQKDPAFDDNSTMLVGITSLAGSTVPSRGADPVEFDDQPNIFTFQLARSDTRWLVARIVLLS